MTEGFKHSNENCADIPSQISLKDFIRERLAASGKDEESQEFVSELAEMWGGFVGDSVQKQSLKWFWLEECLDGGKSPDFSPAVYLAKPYRQSFRLKHSPGDH